MRLSESENDSYRKEKPGSKDKKLFENQWPKGKQRQRGYDHI